DPIWILGCAHPLHCTNHLPQRARSGNLALAASIRVAMRSGGAHAAVRIHPAYGRRSSTLQQPPSHDLAQLNVGRIRYEVADPRMADFTNNLALVNGIAEHSAGFIWRYVDESGNATNTRPYADPRILINISVWESIVVLSLYQPWIATHSAP